MLGVEMGPEVVGEGGEAWMDEDEDGIVAAASNETGVPTKRANKE